MGKTCGPSRALDPFAFRLPPSALVGVDQARAAEIEALLMEKLERWDALEVKAKARWQPSEVVLSDHWMTHTPPFVLRMTGGRL
jgi:hypothetical protein